MPAHSRRSKAQMGKHAKKQPRADQADRLADAAARAADGAAAARARARRVRGRVACHLPSHLHRARRLGTACVAACAAHTRPLADARPRVPHTHRADRTIKKKPRGRRNPPANEAVTKWLIIETLESATLEEIVQFAFCVCDA